MNLGDEHCMIGGVWATAAQHASHMRDEGLSDRCIGYFVGKALDRAWSEGERPGPAAVIGYDRLREA